jgi:uncharacterized phage-associated protein
MATPVTIFQLAKHILLVLRQHTITGDDWKLQKLCYFAHAHYLGLGHGPLVATQFQAWRDGPVSPELRNGRASIQSADPLPVELQAHVNRVLVDYAHKSTNELCELSHYDLIPKTPWKFVRRDTPDGEHSSEPIPDDVTQDYYTELLAVLGKPVEIGFEGTVEELFAHIRGQRVNAV